MDFKTVRIPYWGRAKYNVYGTGDSIRSIIQNYMGPAGGGSAAGGGDGYGGNENRGGNGTSFFAYLDKGSVTYSDTDLMGEGVSEFIHLYGFKNMDRAQTLIGNLDNSGATTSGLTKYDISGRTQEEGLELEVLNNGTTATTIHFHFSTGLPDTGELQIPINVNVNDNPLDPYHEAWYNRRSWTNSTVLTFSWGKAGAGSSSYVLDLSNETAQINCDSGGNMYSASIMTVVCTATTTFNGEPVSGVVYSCETKPQYEARGINVNSNTGEIWFTYSGSGQYFAFNGASLPIDVRATYSGRSIGVKTMTIYKNYPGQDGSPATSHWINTSVSQVLYNPNKTGAEALTPSAVTADVWKQVGYLPPEIDTATTIFYGYSTEEPTDVLPAGVPAEAIYSEDYISFALRLENSPTGAIYEIETVPIIPGGLNGESGATGASGKSGTDGESAWYLTLDNDNATVNCETDGTIIQTSANRITCNAKLYHGNEFQSGATYTVNYGDATGVVTGKSNGILSISFNNLNFTGDNLSIAISGYGGDLATYKDGKIMNITKSYAGASGEPAVSYWVEVSTSEVLYDPNKSGNQAVVPGTVSAAAKMMKGALAPSNATGVTMEWCKISRTTGGEIDRTSYTPKATINLSTADCIAYKALRFYIFKGSGQVDMEEIPILKNGLDGSGQTRTGAAIRGPYDYYAVSGSNQCWCGGNAGEDGCTECEKWIDIIYKDGTYYRCTESYYGKCSTAHTKGINNSAYWTAGENYNFIATNLLLASSASITFLTNNELYLKYINSLGHEEVTGGAAGGSGITFWAGAENPADANFQVDYQGNITARTGTFAGYIQYPYTFVSELSVKTVSFKKYGNNTSATGYVGDNRAYLVSDWMNSANAMPYFFLPFPTSAWNGFTYDIIVEPQMARGETTKQWLDLVVSGATGTTSAIYDRGTIYCYAFTEVRDSREYVLTGGRYQITCMPKRVDSTHTYYNWAITMATGGLWKAESTTSTECLSTLVATAYDTDPIYKLTTYTGNNNPSGQVRNPNLTMFIKK